MSLKYLKFLKPNNTNQSCAFTFTRVAVAESLNNTMIGGKKRNYYHDDIWNIKYLKKFKWDHLTEKVAYERRVREQKLRLETMQAKRCVITLHASICRLACRC